jgi:hypothetical protein
MGVVFINSQMPTFENRTRKQKAGAASFAPALLAHKTVSSSQ